jgi:hypothetical protein
MAPALPRDKAGRRAAAPIRPAESRAARQALSRSRRHDPTALRLRRYACRRRETPPARGLIPHHAPAEPLPFSFAQIPPAGGIHALHAAPPPASAAPHPVLLLCPNTPAGGLRAFRAATPPASAAPRPCPSSLSKYLPPEASNLASGAPAGQRRATPSASSLPKYSRRRHPRSPRRAPAGQRRAQRFFFAEILPPEASNARPKRRAACYCCATSMATESASPSPPERVPRTGAASS